METLAALDTTDQIRAAGSLMWLLWVAIGAMALFVIIRAAVRSGMGQARRDAERERRHGGGLRGPE